MCLMAFACSGSPTERRAMAGKVYQQHGGVLRGVKLQEPKKKALGGAHPLPGGAVAGQPGVGSLSQRVPSSSLVTSPARLVSATRNSSYCLQREPLMKTSGALKLRCRHVLQDQRCGKGSGKPGINCILLERRALHRLQPYLS